MISRLLGTNLTAAAGFLPTNLADNSSRIIWIRLSSGNRAVSVSSCASVVLELVGPIQDDAQHLVRSDVIFFLQHHETLTICSHIIVRPEIAPSVWPLEEKTRGAHLKCRFGMHVDCHHSVALAIEQLAAIP